MKSQTPYRVNDNKKVKLTKAEKIYDALQKERNRAVALVPKKTVTS